MMNLKDWCKQYPLLTDLIAYKETTWFNPLKEQSAVALAKTSLSNSDISAAADRLDRFRPFIIEAFPETRGNGGLIESPLRPIPMMKKKLNNLSSVPLSGQLLLKCDNLLPISGSVKARGGIYAVLKYAEQIAVANKLLRSGEDYSVLLKDSAIKIFSRYRIAVGSTGNLGLSIGIMGARFGFNVTVHMSADAREWKKDLLRSHGVEVIQYDADYSQAVATGRRQAEKELRCHFIDDENSTDLFLGYAVSAGRLQKQLNQMAIPVDEQHPLFVYLPCGVGGGPGGITFGLKQIFGDNVHCFFAEPTHSPCMLLGLYTNLHDKISIRDIGLNNETAADGLAVSRPSGFIGRMMAPLIDGVFTVSDEEMFRMLAHLSDTEGVRMEPSALAGMSGTMKIQSALSYQDQHLLKRKMDSATHIVWGTGGSMVPAKDMEEYYQKGKRFIFNKK